MPMLVSWLFTILVIVTCGVSKKLTVIVSYAVLPKLSVNLTTTESLRFAIAAVPEK